MPSSSATLTHQKAVSVTLTTSLESEIQKIVLFKAQLQVKKSVTKLPAKLGQGRACYGAVKTEVLLKCLLFVKCNV